MICVPAASSQIGRVLAELDAFQDTLPEALPALICGGCTVLRCHVVGVRSCAVMWWVNGPALLLMCGPRCQGCVTHGGGGGGDGGKGHHGVRHGRVDVVASCFLQSQGSHLCEIRFTSHWRIIIALFAFLA